MCLFGLVWGAWRLSPYRGYRLRDHRQASPYAGWMRWHHYLGLIFGFTTMMFVFSGMLSMDPWYGTRARPRRAINASGWRAVRS